LDLKDFATVSENKIAAKKLVQRFSSLTLAQKAGAFGPCQAFAT
jgi:hypothetical protein